MLESLAIKGWERNRGERERQSRVIEERKRERATGWKHKLHQFAKQGQLTKRNERLEEPRSQPSPDFYSVMFKSWASGTKLRIWGSFLPKYLIFSSTNLERNII